MKKYNTNTRYNLSKNINEVNCIGVFKSDFFGMASLMKRQEEIYEQYKIAISSKNTDQEHEMANLYEATEVMRITLLECNLKDSKNTHYN